MHKVDSSRSGFTLIELLIAIFLVSLLSYFVFSTPRAFKEAKIEINETNLPQHLRASLQEDGELICVNSCKECYYFYTTSTGPKKFKFPLPPSTIQGVYILDPNNNPVKVDLGRFRDKKVCLRLYHYKIGSISQVILELKDSYLFMPAYFGEGKTFGTLGEAVDWWLKDNDKISSKSSWY
jgi:prepilin-type N-terminal cleavage/methylation domain-containing protein